jgi:membrane-bound metal-dependent hydrolase YbcI (DUF457 family)
MDPISHAALGRTLAALSPHGRVARGAVAAATLGALSPDLDAVVMPFGWDRYLYVHEIGTHALIGTVACAALTATLVGRFGRGTRWALLMWFAWLGAASHVVLDLVSSGRIRVLWPFVDAQVSVPLVAMADPWLAATLALGAVAIWMRRWNQHQVAVTVLSIACGFLATKAVLAFQAVEAYRAAQVTGTPIESYIVDPAWSSLHEWRIFDRTPSHVRVWRADGVTRTAELELSWPTASDATSVAPSRTLSTVRNFLRAHDLTFAVLLPRPENREWILWSDIRYCRQAAAGESPTESDASGSSIIHPNCTLWFGGEFDRSGRALREIVKIGGFTQTRTPGG